VSSNSWETLQHINGKSYHSNEKVCSIVFGKAGKNFGKAGKFQATQPKTLLNDVMTMMT